MDCLAQGNLTSGSFVPWPQNIGSFFAWSFIIYARLSDKDGNEGRIAHGLELGLERQPRAHDHDAGKSALRRQTGEEAYRAALTEAANDDAVRWDACVHFCSDDLVQLPHSAQHA